MRATVVLVLKGQCQVGELISFKLRAAEMGLSCNELAKRGLASNNVSLAWDLERFHIRQWK